MFESIGPRLLSTPDRQSEAKSHGQQLTHSHHTIIQFSNGCFFDLVREFGVKFVIFINLVLSCKLEGPGVG